MTDHRLWQVLPHQPLFFFYLPTPLAHHAPGTASLWLDDYGSVVRTGRHRALCHPDTCPTFWADVHAILGALAGGRYVAEAKLEPLDTETACAPCALVFAGLFVTRVAVQQG